MRPPLAPTPFNGHCFLLRVVLWSLLPGKVSLRLERQIPLCQFAYFRISWTTIARRTCSQRCKICRWLPKRIRNLAANFLWFAVWRLKYERSPALNSASAVAGRMDARIVSEAWPSNENSRRQELSTAVKESGRPGSNRRHPAWEASALPTELRPRWTSLCQDFGRQSTVP
jgi:hypothetical protein